MLTEEEEKEVRDVAGQIKALLMSLPTGELRKAALHEVDMCLECCDGPAGCQCWNDE